MAALVPTVPTRTGTTSAGAAVASPDTISSSILGSQGAILEILNGNASSDSMTISDAGSTQAGTPLAGGTFSASVTNGTNKAFYISPKQADPVTGNVTVTHTVTATVTYKLFPLG